MFKPFFFLEGGIYEFFLLYWIAQLFSWNYSGEPGPLKAAVVGLAAMNKGIKVIVLMFDKISLRGIATKRSITQRLWHKTELLLNVAAHNVAVTKRKSYIT